VAELGCPVGAKGVEAGVVGAEHIENEDVCHEDAMAAGVASYQSTP
jgi:hypothetical protein